MELSPLVEGRFFRAQLRLRETLTKTPGFLRHRHDLVYWAIPCLVAALTYQLSERRIAEVIGLAIGLAVLAIFSSRPAAALLTLVGFLPLQAPIFGLLLGFHVPASLLRNCSALKELLALSLLIAALGEIRATNQRLDLLDKAILIYLAVTVAYLSVPHLFAPGSPLAWAPRINAWRVDSVYMIVFFSVRHCTFTERVRTRFTQVVFSIGMLTAGFGLYQAVSPSGFQHLLLNRLRQVDYLYLVVKEPASEIEQALHWVVNPHPLHVSSIFTSSPYDMADYMVLVAGLAIARITANRRSPWNYVVLAGAVAMIFLSRVRADGLAVLIVVGLALIPAPRQVLEGRIRLMLGVVLAAAILVPSLGGTTFLGGEGARQTNYGHVKELRLGVDLIGQHPLGLGLGEQAVNATRYQSQLAVPSGVLQASGSVVQVGDELGLQALLPWIVIVGAVFGRLWRSRRSDPFVEGATLALVGILVAGEFHHVFVTYPLAWTLWAAIGLALPNNHTVQDTPSTDRPRIATLTA